MIKIPKKLQPRVDEAWKDSDGYWVVLRAPWVSPNGERGVHEDSQRQLWQSVGRAVEGREK